MSKKLKVRAVNLRIITTLFCAMSSFLSLTQHVHAASTSSAPGARIITIAPSNTIPEDMQTSLEEAIQTCEKKYEDVKQLRIRFDEVIKPGPNASRDEMNHYKSMDLYQKFFDGHFGQFAEFMNMKITLREINDQRTLPAAQEEFTQNCRQFSEFLEGFVEWAINGKAPPGMESTYQKQFDEFKNMGM